MHLREEKKNKNYHEEIDFKKLIEDMNKAVKGKLSAHWKEIKPYSEKEIKSFSESIKLIAKLKLEGKIDEEQARLHLEIQKNAMRIVFLTNKVLGLLAVEAAINAAIDVVKSTVNTAIGWTIL